jgi:hypothetical protein
MPDPTNDKPKCGATRRDGQLCELQAGTGTDHLGFGSCKFHGGCTPSHKRAAEKAQLVAAAAMFGLPRNVDPATAIVEALHKMAGQIDFYQAEVNTLGSLWCQELGNVPGVMAPHPAITLYNKSLVDYFNFAEKTVKLGLAERMVKADELVAIQMAALVTSLLGDPELKLTREQQERGRQIAGAQLREMAIEASSHERTE